MAINHQCPHCGAILRELEDVSAHNCTFRTAGVEPNVDEMVDLWFCSGCNEHWDSEYDYRAHECPAVVNAEDQAATPTYEPTICGSCGTMFTDQDHEIGHVCDGIANRPDRGDVSVGHGSVTTAQLDEDALDDLVARGSVPDLATLFKKGKEKGLITAGKEYGSTV
jgi:predicted RNA-binding Zn-ribbon protein involved in translation (DUF1610 family)